MTLLNSFDSPLCVRLMLTLAHFLWQGLVIALVAVTAASPLRRATAQARYLVYAVALVLMAACPVMTMCSVGGPVASPVPGDIGAGGSPAHVVSMAHDAVPTSGPLALRSASTEATEALIDQGSLPATAGPSARADTPSAELNATIGLDWPKYSPIVTAVYLAGVVGMLGRLALGLHGGRRLCRRSQPVDDPGVLAAVSRKAKALGLRIPPVVAFCRQVAVPTVIGVLRPTILLPLSLASGLAPDQIEAILTHELAHIRRYDTIVNLLQRLIEAFLFFHPAVWFITRRIRVEREHCCDDLVVSLGAKPLAYATSLIQVAELCHSVRIAEPLGAAAGLSATGRPSRLGQRIRRLIGGPAQPQVRVGLGWPLTVVAMSVIALAVPFLVSSRAGQATADRAAESTESDAATSQPPPDVEAVLGDPRLKHWQVVTAVAVSPDSQTIASSGGGTITLWDAASGREKLQLDGHGGQVGSLAFSPDGRTLASASHDKSVKLWDLVTGKERARLTGHTDWVWSVVFRPDGQTVVSASEDGTIGYWDVASGRELRCIDSGQKVIFWVAFSPDGKTLASASGDQTLKLWDAETGQELRTMRHDERVHSVAFSPDGAWLATGCEKTMKIWNRATGEEVRTIEAQREGHINCVAFSPDGRRLASAGTDGTIKFWDPGTGQRQRTLPHTGTISSLAFSPDGQTFVSGGDIVQVWDLTTGLERHVSGGHAGQVSCVAFSPDGRTLASGSTDHTVRIWDVARTKEQSVLQGHTEGVMGIAFGPDGRLLASGGSDGTIGLWEVPGTKLRFRWAGFESTVYGVAFSPDGRTVAAVGSNSRGDAGPLRLWDTETGEERTNLRLPTRPFQFMSVAFSPDGRTLILRSPESGVLHWDPTSGAFSQGPESRLIGQFPDARAWAYISDGATVAATGRDNTLRVWNVGTGAEQWTLKGDNTWIFPVAFSSDGRRLATSAAGGAVQVWNVATGASLKTFALRPARGRIHQVAFSPDGLNLATANGNGTVYLLRLPDRDDAAREPSSSQQTKQHTELLKALESGNSSVREQAAESIAEIGKAAVPALIEAMKGDAGPLREGIALAMAKIGPEAVPHLIQALRHDSDRVRYRTTCALEVMGPQAKAAIPALIEAFRDEDEMVRENAADALRAIGPVSTPALLEAITSKSLRMRNGAVTAFEGWLEPDKAITLALVQVLKDPSPALRQKAAGVLGNLHGEKLMQITSEDGHHSQLSRSRLDSGWCGRLEHVGHAATEAGQDGFAGQLVAGAQDRTRAVRAIDMDELGRRVQHPD